MARATEPALCVPLLWGHHDIDCHLGSLPSTSGTGLRKGRVHMRGRRRLGVIFLAHTLSLYLSANVTAVLIFVLRKEKF